MIECKICGAKVQAVQVHIKKDHPDWTMDRYREEFPGAPEMTEEVRKRLEERKQAAVRNNMSVTAKVASMPEGKKVSLHELFNLGKVKAAMNGKGNPIPIDVMPTPSDEFAKDLIPTSSPEYVYDIGLLKTMCMAFAKNIPVYLFGPPGVGKSSLPKQVCAKTNRPLVRLQHTPNTEESHIIGEWRVRNVKCEKSGELRSETYYELGLLPLAMLNGWVYMADEYDRAWPSVLSVYQAVLEGEPLVIKDAPPEYRVIRPHPDFRFVATGNTNGSGDESGLFQATVQQDAATIERFGVVEMVDYLPKKQEIAILRQAVGLNEEDASRLVSFATAVRESYPHELSLPIGPRVLINVGNLSIAKGNFIEGVKLAYANRLPESERQAAIEVAKRELGGE